MFASAIGPAILGILILLWWLTLSRAGWTEALTRSGWCSRGIRADHRIVRQTMQDTPPIVMITFRWVWLDLRSVQSVFETFGHDCERSLRCSCSDRFWLFGAAIETKVCVATSVRNSIGVGIHQRNNDDCYGKGIFRKRGCNLMAISTKFSQWIADPSGPSFVASTQWLSRRTGN